MPDFNLTNFQYQDHFIWSFELDVAVSAEHAIDVELANLTEGQFLPFQFSHYSGVQTGRKYIDVSTTPVLNRLSEYLKSELGTFYHITSSIPQAVIRDNLFHPELWSSKDRVLVDVAFHNSAIKDEPRFNIITHVDSSIIVGTFIMNLVDNGEVGTEFFSDDNRSVFKASGKKYSGYFFLNTRKSRHNMFQTLHRDRFALMGSLYPKGL
jgi:hypothetical protein